MLSFRVSVIVVAGLFLSACATGKKQVSQSNSTPVLWTTTEAVNTPESAHYDQQTDQVFVSNVAGQPNEKDGNGYISRFTITGQLIQDRWVTDLNAPKGMRVVKGKLWVTDIDEVISIDIATGKIEKRFKPKNAKFLNDIAVGPGGEIYVSDTFAERIFVIRKNRVSTFAQGPQLEAPNGLYVADGRLIVAGWGTEIKADFSTKSPGHLYALDLKTKAKTLITPTPLGNLDGIEMTKDGSFFVTDWIAGRLYRVSPHGSSTLLVEGLKGAADVGWIPTTNTVIVPRMMEGQVSAYTVQ